MYGQLFALLETDGLRLLTKEQIQQWITFTKEGT
jgi:hypothetical protein